MSKIRLRPARVAECAELTDLIMRSKASNGYDAAFMEACRAELTVTPEILARGPFAVLEADGKLIGTAQVSREEDVWHLQLMFVDPACQGMGAGRRLIDWAMTEAGLQGASELHIEADPNAEAFYLRSGAHRVGAAPSGSIPGRMIPLMILPLSPG
ncbi:MAG: GNAT family N-acetyltransferase [Minwuia sp.]|nr:GNAT family N-acetyltransferase [Minwuia sp.]